MSFADLTTEQAEAYRARVEADGPNRLRLLARLMHADGRDLAVLDATIPSLTPLWQWYVPFVRAGMRGLPDATARYDVVEPAGPDFRAAGFAAELLAHYMYRVARTCFSGVGWTVREAPGMDSHHKIYVSYDNDEGGTGRAFVEGAARGTIAMVTAGEEEFLAPDLLTTRFLTGPFLCGPGTAQRCLAIPRGDSVLLPLLREDLDPEVAWHLSTSVAEHQSPSSIGGEFVLAHMGADMESLETAPPLPADRIVAVLDRLGFRTVSGDRPEVDSIARAGMAEFARDDALVTTLAAAGELRAIHLESGSPTPAAWAELEQTFRGLAAEVGGRFAPEDEF